MHCRGSQVRNHEVLLEGFDLPRDTKKGFVRNQPRGLACFSPIRISLHHRHIQSIIYFNTKGSISELSKRGTLASPSSFQSTTPHSSPVPTWNIYRQLEWKRQFSRGRPGMDSLHLCARWTHLNTSAASPTALSSNPQRNRTDASTTHDPDQYTIESKLTMFL